MAIAYKYAGKVRGYKETIADYIVVTANDTTSPIHGKTISNLDGRITRVSFGEVVTNQAGSSPTLQTTLEGSLDGTTFFTLDDSSGSAIQTSALDISTASSTTVSQFKDTNTKGISKFPPYLRLSTTTGGTGTPGFTGTIMLEIDWSPVAIPQV